VRDEFLGQPERRVGDDALTPGRQPLQQKIAPIKARRIPVVDEIGSKDLMSGCAQRPYDCPAAAAGWFPQTRRQALATQQRRNRNTWSLIEIVPALGESMALYLATVVEHVTHTHNTDGGEGAACRAASRPSFG